MNIFFSSIHVRTSKMLAILILAIQILHATNRNIYPALYRIMSCIRVHIQNKSWLPLWIIQNSLTQSQAQEEDWCEEGYPSIKNCHFYLDRSWLRIPYTLWILGRRSRRQLSKTHSLSIQSISSRSPLHWLNLICSMKETNNLLQIKMTLSKNLRVLKIKKRKPWLCCRDIHVWYSPY